MQKILPSDKIYIAQSKISKAGRGVFAKIDIKKGEVVENCPVILIPKDHTPNLGESILATYSFYCGKNKEQSAIALGFGSIYNHSYVPNADYKIAVKNKVINIVAIRDIKNSEEITLNYNHENSNNNDPLWFE